MTESVDLATAFDSPTAASMRAKPNAKWLRYDPDVGWVSGEDGRTLQVEQTVSEPLCEPLGDNVDGLRHVLLVNAPQRLLE